MPVVEVALAAPGCDFSMGPLSGIIDTGADITLVPTEYLRQLNAPVVASGYLRSPWGGRYGVRIYEISLRIGGYDLHGVEVASDPGGREVLLGRNVLNQLDLRLDGPNEAVTVLSG